MPALLVVEDEAVLGRSLVKVFVRSGFAAELAGTLADARRMLAEVPVDLVLLDLRLPDGSGLDFLEEIMRSDPERAVITMTAHGSVADAVRAMQMGARDYVQKPFDLEEIQLKVKEALRRRREQREISYYRERDLSAGSILGISPAAERLRSIVERIGRMTGGPGAPAPTILLLGETGSGKGHVARALHAGGGRSGGPFIEVNCTALPETLVEAELFGYERGAFTDAKAARPGLFETAEGGTLFLDEIGHVSPLLQAKFLKVIEDKTVRRLGSSTARKIDVQIIAATNRDLEAAVRLGEFRDDLFQRLSVAVIRIPPLRERDGDAVELARSLLGEMCRRYGLPARTLSPEAETAIARYAWPGNVRELANSMERIVLFSDAATVGVDDLGLGTAAPAPGRIAVAASGEVEIQFPDGGISLESVERALIARALEKAAGNQSAAARLLGISRDTLRYRLEKFANESA
jgi:DNA-binding NtrC family response regulator